VQTPVLFVLKPRLEGRVLVMQEKLSFGIGLPSYEFQDSHGNITYRSTFMPGRNEIRHDALVAVSSLPDSREFIGNIVPVGQLPHELLRYTLPSRYCDSDKLMNFAWNNFGQIPTASARAGHLRLGSQQHRIPLRFRASRPLRVGSHRASPRRLPRFRPCGHRAVPRVSICPRAT
jgi:hypothetical protein